MPVIRLKPEEWTTVSHAETGHVLRFAYRDLGRGGINVTFDDDAHRFEIRREKPVNPWKKVER